MAWVDGQSGLLRMVLGGKMPWCFLPVHLAMDQDRVVPTASNDCIDGYWGHEFKAASFAQILPFLVFRILQVFQTVC